MSKVRLNPYTVASMFTPEIEATKTNEPDKIVFYLDAGDDEKAEEELIAQLMGSKFSTGKLVRHAATSKRFIACARVKKNIEMKNQAKKNAERCLGSVEKGHCRQDGGERSLGESQCRQTSLLQFVP